VKAHTYDPSTQEAEALRKILNLRPETCLKKIKQGWKCDSSGRGAYLASTSLSKINNKNQKFKYMDTVQTLILKFPGNRHKN
jgi:hypothetical protein